MKTLISLLLLLTSLSRAERGSRISEIVVSASLAEQEAVLAPASISVVPQKDLEQKPYADIGKALSQAEGVVLTGSNDRGISLRGLSSAYTLILVDGKRLNSRSLAVRHNADADLSWIPLADIERIEVIRGPMATIYGSDAIGGVVNIITKKITNNWRRLLSVSTKVPQASEDTNLNQGELLLSGPLIKDQLGLKVSASSATQEQPHFVSTDSRQYNGHRDYGLTSSLTYRPFGGHEVNFDFSKNHNTQMGRYAGVDFESEVYRTSYSLGHQYKSDQLSTEFEIFQNSYDQTNSEGQADLREEGVKGLLKIPAGQSHFIVAGLEVEKNSLKDEAQITTGSTSNTQGALFIEDSLSLTPQATLTVGVRQTKHEKFGANTSPRVYLVYNASSEWTFKGGVGTGFKTPSLLQLEKDFKIPSCRGNCIMAGNPDLNPEKSINYELSALFGQKDKSLSLTLFRTELTDMISTYFDVINGQRYRLLHNVGQARSQGVEFSSSVSLTETVQLGLNLIYADAKNLDNDTRLTNTPELVSNLRAEWFVSDSVSVLGNISYSGERDIESGGSTLRASSYSLTNLSASYKISENVFREGRLAVGIDNLFDHTLDQTYGFGEPGRMYFAKLTLGF